MDKYILKVTDPYNGQFVAGENYSLKNLRKTAERHLRSFEATEAIICNKEGTVLETYNKSAVSKSATESIKGTNKELKVSNLISMADEHILAKVSTETRGTNKKAVSAKEHLSNYSPIKQAVIENDEVARDLFSVADMDTINSKDEISNIGKAYSEEILAELKRSIVSIVAEYRACFNEDAKQVPQEIVDLILSVKDSISEQIFANDDELISDRLLKLNPAAERDILEDLVNNLEKE